MPNNKSNNGVNLGFEAVLWATANKQRGHMDPGEYKHVVLGLIFLKYISDAFKKLHDKLTAQQEQGADPGDRDEYKAENVLWVPKVAGWSFIQSNAKQPTIGKLMDTPT